MKNLFVGVLTWKLINKHFSTHPNFSLHNGINSSEQPTGCDAQTCRLVGLNNNSQSKISRLNVMLRLDICRTTPRIKEWVRDTKFRI